ncbi:MAG TPA: carboxypeptidase-like regulatory domain-containing protein [Candidatus Acidoferrales bacterium]|nr:carboxypeptidase-like regulatory domain-containing protein [Candidatus Acidoferrales bacterium]
MRLRALLLGGLLTVGLVPAARAAAGGRLGGMVVAQGTPQLGALVVVTPEGRPGSPLRLFTNTQGIFSSRSLLPGLYSVRVRLTGFLPAFEPQIHVTPGQMTLLRIELGSVFSSVEELRHGPHHGQDPDEWNWVLRSATLTRPVLRFSGGRVVTDDPAPARRAHGRAELAAGSLASWSPVDPDTLGSTAFLYDQGFDGTSHLLLAGRVGYQYSATANFAATWIPQMDETGEPAQATTVVFRQSQMGEYGPWFHGMALEHTERLQLGQGVQLQYGARYDLASLHGTASGARPEARLRVDIQPGWVASFLLASSPEDAVVSDGPLNPLDSFPTPLRSNGRLELAQSWHEEIALDRAFSPGATLSAAVFRDSSADTAIYGRGSISSPNSESDSFSDAFVYDGGSLKQWGARLGYKQKFANHWQAAVFTSWSRGLAAGSGDSTASLRRLLAPRGAPSVGGRVSGRIESWGTELSAGYQWIDGPILTRPDPFGGSLYGVEPYLNASIRQPLPGIHCPRIVAVVDLRNLLGQGYVRLETGDGRAVLIPAARAFRGGFAVQF